MNQYELERFHHFDGVHHADGGFNNGDIVQVEEPLVGVDKNGQVYHVDASGWFTKNIVQLMSALDSSGHVTINDGTSLSPIVITNASPNSFSDASYLNQLLFKPWVISTTIAGQVIDTTGKVTTQAIDAAGNVISGTTDFLGGLGKNLKWVVIAIVIIGVFYLFKSLKTT